MRNNRNTTAVAEYIHFLSVKHGVDCETMLRSLIHARENHEVACGKLSIECRQKTRDHDIFLITNEERVVAQFPIPKYFLDQPNQARELKLTHLFRKAKPDIPINPNHIQDLRCGMKRINLKARVVEVPKANLVYTRFGEYARVTNAVIADETGTIKLCLWNERINAVSADSTIEIENANVIKFRGENQLRLGKNGRLNTIENTSPQRSDAIERSVIKTAP